MGIHDMGDAWAPEEEDAERGLSGTSRTSGRVRRTRILDDREYDVSYCPRVAIDKKIRVGLWYDSASVGGQANGTQLDGLILPAVFSAARRARLPAASSRRREQHT
ncbi:hypothetical protein C6P46_000427 [Rhodotorula mucilaginosa]|uniref:Uncharacterized protein n=1 Tax=Rhodotorula mucilaginosa TaxID=5537 RepID=A0A9P7B3E3_RHOMI|nr:hypothetical protein C6P46_000427 [Rhodotorula mucilaginosa]